MRDLLYKNLTSSDKKRKIITSTETAESSGIRSVIHRHFIYMAKEITTPQAEKTSPYLYVIKSRDDKAVTEKFFWRMKGSVIVENNDKTFLISFAHSLKINLTSIPTACL